MKKFILIMLILFSFLFSSCRTTNSGDNKENKWKTAGRTVKVITAESISGKVISQLHDAVNYVDFVYADKLDLSRQGYYLIISIDGYKSEAVHDQGLILAGGTPTNGFGGTYNGIISFTYLEMSNVNTISSDFTDLIAKGNFFPPEMMNLFTSANNSAEGEMKVAVKSVTAEQSGTRESNEPVSTGPETIKPDPWWMKDTLVLTEILDNSLVVTNIDTKEKKTILKIEPVFKILDDGGVKLKIVLTSPDKLVDRIHYTVMLQEKRNNLFGYTKEADLEMDRTGKGIVEFSVPVPRYSIEKYAILKLSLHFATSLGYGFENWITYPSLPVEKNPVIGFRSSDIDLWEGDGVFSNLISPRVKNPASYPERNSARVIPLSDNIKDNNDVIFNNGAVRYPFQVSKPSTFDVVKINLGAGTSKMGEDTFPVKFNTILLVDKAALPHVYLISEQDWVRGLSDEQNVSYPNVVRSLMLNKGYIDAGAILMVPFDPVEIKPSDTGLEFILNWRNLRDTSTMKIDIKPY